MQNLIQNSQPFVHFLNRSPLLSSAGNGAPTNTICGNNNGQHMYLECGDESSQTSIRQMTSGENFMRLFRYRVSQIQCNTAWTPRSGCTQWFDALQGRFRTYNRRGNQILANNDVT